MHALDSPQTVVRTFLAAAIALILAVSLSLRLAVNALLEEGNVERNVLRTTASLFDIGLEANVATWFSSMLLFAVAALLVTRALLASQRSGWLTLAAIAVILSMDEASEIHERLAGVAAERIELPGVSLQFAWVVPGAMVAAVLVWVGHRATRSIPQAQRKRFAVAGGIFFLGALGIEAVSGEVFARYGSRSILYVLTYHAEEAAELIGVALALSASFDALDVLRTEEGVFIAGSTP